MHSSGKEEPIPKTILGDGQENHWDLDLARSKRKDHRAAEDVPRSGPTEMRDQVAVQGMEFLGSVAKMGEIQLHGKPSKGIAPQPMGTQGDQKEKEARILLSTWKLNAFTCFAASSWGERIVEVDACCVQLVFGKHGFDF